MAHKNLSAVGIIGAGRLGTAIARQALIAGYTVNMANSRNPASLELTLRMLLPGAIALTVQDVAQKSDVIILAMPLHQYKMLGPSLFAGKIVIDAMNYWPPTEGNIPEFMSPHVTSSEYLQQYFKEATIVKTLNHVAYHELVEQAVPSGTSGRRAIALSGGDSVVKLLVEQLIDSLGFDAVDLGALEKGCLIQPDTPLFNTRLTKKEMRQLVASTSLE